MFENLDVEHDDLGEIEENSDIEVLDLEEFSIEELELEDDAVEMSDLEEFDIDENDLNETTLDSLYLEELLDDETGAEDSTLELIKDITPEVLESRERDTEETLENYRENLRGYGVDEEKIEEYIVQEREKINAEYESWDKGDTSSNIYYQPNNWEEVAASLNGGGMSEGINENLINYDEIYDEIQRGALEQGFENIQIDLEPERLDDTLKGFDSAVWEGMSLEEQKETMENLSDYVVDVIGFDTPPTIDYYYNPVDGDFGGYDSNTNTLNINEYMLNDSDEAADTIAHELWHAHQKECSMNPQSALDYQYQYNFENYIPPELGQEPYENQLIEAEARAFASQFKDRLEERNGRSR